MANGSLHFESTLSNEQYKAGLKNMVDSTRSASNQIIASAGGMDKAFSSLGAKMAAIFSVGAITSFANKIIQTRAYFQDIESSMKVFLGSAEKAERFTSQLKDYAYYNMFEFKDLAKASQQLIAYGNDVEDVIDIIDKLSNVATGTKVPLQEMVDLYNRAKNLGEIDSRGLQSWAAKGLVLTDILKDMGVEVSKNKISFEQLNMALEKVTSEGGMFYNLMDEMMPNISSSIGQLQDEIANMFDEIGRGMQDSLRAGIDAASWAVNHYREIGKVLLQIIALYGSYKAALILVATYQKLAIGMDNIRLIMMFRKELGLLKATQQAFNITVLKNPYVAVAAAILAVVSAIAIWGKKTKEQSKATGDISEQINKEIKELDDLTKKIKSATTSQADRQRSLDEWQTKYGGYLTTLNEERVTVENLTQAYKDAKAAIVDKILAEGRGNYMSETMNKAKETEDALIDALKSSKSFLGISGKQFGEIEASIRQMLSSVTDDNVGISTRKILDYLSSQGLKSGNLIQFRKQNQYANIMVALSDALDAAEDKFLGEEWYKDWAEGVKKSFGIGEPEPQQKESKLFKEYLSEKKTLYNEEKAKLQKLIKEGTVDEVEAQKKVVEDLEKQLKDYGYNPKTGNKLTATEKEAHKRAERAKELNDELQSVMQQLENDYTNQQIAVKKDGWAKEREELIQAQNQEEQTVQDWYVKMLDGERKYQMELYEIKHGKKAPADYEMQANENTQRIEDTKEARLSVIRERYKMQNEELARKEREEEEKAEAEYLISYGDFQEKKLGITKKYAQLIANAKNKWEKKSLEKQRDTELFNLERSAKGSLEKIFRDVSKQSKGTLNEMLKDANKLLNEMKARGDDNVEGFKALQEQINAIQDSLDEMEELDWGWGIDQLVTGLSKVVSLRKKESELRQKAKEAEKSGNSAEADVLNKRADNLQENSKRIGENIKKNWIAFGVNTFVSDLQRAAELAQQIAEITGNESLANWAEEASALAQNFQAAAQGAATGGWIGAIVGGVSDMINQTISSVMEAKAWVAQYKASIREFRDAIELADIVFDPHRFSDMFGNRSLESAVDAYRAINDLSAKYTEQVTAAFELGERQKKNVSKGLGIFGGILALGGAGIEPWFGFKKKTTQKWYSELDAYERGMNKLQAIQVRVKKASGWAKLWGGQDKYKSLFDVAPELWGGDINGEFDVERAKKFLETSKQLTDEQRRQIEQAIKYKEELDKAKEALEQVIGDTVGSFADDMADSVWEAITKGADAWEVFREKGNEALVALGKQMLKEFAISTYLEAFKDKLKEAYGSGDTNALAKIYTEIFDGLPAVLENMTLAGQQWVDMLKANGYDITQEGATSGTTGGYTTAMSHEDASEINGRLTDIQGQIRLGVGLLGNLKSDAESIRTFSLQAVEHLYRIERNTAVLSSIDNRLNKIEKNTANL